jgi:hypothetical protein
MQDKGHEESAKPEINAEKADATQSEREREREREREGERERERVV